MSRRRQSHDDEWAVVPGWCQDETDLPACRRQLHDSLVAMMGDNRRGGVQWRWWTGEHALAQVAVMAEQAGYGASDGAGFGAIRARLASRGGYLVVAMAKGDRP